MELYFLRHGEAEPRKPNGSDDERRLTSRGEQQTRRVLEALARAGVQADRVISSPLTRARQTAELAHEVLGVAAPLEPDLDPETRLGDVQQLAESGGHRLLFVGHAPHLAEVVGQLTGSAIHLPTSGLARVDARRVEPGMGTLVWLLTPELFDDAR